MDCCYKKVGVIGAGAYGTAIAQCFSVNSREVLLLSDLQEIAAEINEKHTNKALGNINLNQKISCTLDFSFMKDCDIVFIAVPIGAVMNVCSNIKKYDIVAPIVLCSKGVDTDNARLMDSCVEEIISNEIAIFSGPSFAHEIASGLPFGVNVASKNRVLANDISQCLSNDVCFIKPIDDYIGLQIAGAFKNILAVGCGIMRGLKLGNSAIAQFIVDGIGEMVNIASAMGGRAETFLELGGIGDTILTCTSSQSRNVLFGEYIAHGGTLNDWTGNLAEGAYAAKAVPLFSQKYDLPLKIFNNIYTSIYQ